MGSLRDLKREGKKPESDTVKLYSRLRELATEHGNSWARIAEVMEHEGFKEKGEPLTANALRKRYIRWKESEREARLPVSSNPPASESMPPQGAIPGIKELISLNNQLLAQLQDSNRMIVRLERRIYEQELKTSHTEHTTEQPVSSRDLIELLKEFGAGRLQMMHIEEERKDYVAREEVQQLIEETVEDRVESELKTMLSQEGSFSKELTHLVDLRLKTLFSGGEPVAQTPHAGPGRGRRGKTHKKFSASLEESLFERVKSLPGQFSGHLSNALEAYLSVVEVKKPE